MGAHCTGEAGRSTAVTALAFFVSRASTPVHALSPDGHALTQPSPSLFSRRQEAEGSVTTGPSGNSQPAVAYEENPNFFLGRRDA